MENCRYEKCGDRRVRMDIRIWKNGAAVFAAASILLLLSMGIALTVVYADYVYSPNEGFTYLSVSAETDVEKYLDVRIGRATEALLQEMKERAGKLADTLDQWAEDQKATLFIRTLLPQYPHVSASLYSVYGKELLQQIRENVETGVYVDQKTFSNPYYTENNVFLPNYVKGEIEGVFDMEDLPKGLQKEGTFLLSLRKKKLPAASLSESQIFTDAEDVNGLIRLLKENGFRGTVQLESGSDRLHNLRKLFYPLNFYNLVLLLVLGGTAGGFIYLTLVRVDSRKEIYGIRHLYGKPLIRVSLDLLLQGLCFFIVSYGLLHLSAPYYGSYMSRADLSRIRQWTGIALFSTTAVTYIVSSAVLCRKIKRR